MKGTMNSKTHITIGPLLALAVALFIATALAPQAWRVGGLWQALEGVTTEGTRELPVRLGRLADSGMWASRMTAPVFGNRRGMRDATTRVPGGVTRRPSDGSPSAAIVPGNLWRRELTGDAVLELPLPGGSNRNLGKRETSPGLPPNATRTMWLADGRLSDPTLSPGSGLLSASLRTRMTSLPTERKEPPPLHVSLPVGQLSRHASHLDATRQTWPMPLALVSQLEAAAGMGGAEQWSKRTREALERLSGLPLWGGQKVDDVLAELEMLGEEAVRLSEAMAESSQRRMLRSIHFALVRRLEVWNSIRTALSQDALAASVSELDGPSLSDHLTRVGRLVGQLPEAEAWEDYLLLDELARAVEPASDGTSPSHRQLAIRWLARLDHTGLTTRQREFLGSPEIRALADQLRGWVTDPVAYADLLERLERVELGDDPLAAGQLGHSIAALRVSGSPAAADLGLRLERNYRNANVRVVLAEDFVSRLFPKEITGRERIRDLVGGARVAGRGRARTQLAVELLPDSTRWRLAVGARGELVSETRSSVGPATFFNQAYSRYQLRHIVTLDDRGLSIEPDFGTAQTSTRLTGLETRLDFVPLLGDVVQSIAQRRYEQRLPRTRRELRSRVARSASNRLEQEMRSRTQEVNDRFGEQLLRPLQELDLNPVPIEMRTSESQLVARYRLSGPRQLAAHTPRPREPEGSLLALQLHQSVLNNGLEKLDLADQRRDLPTLFREIAAAFGREEAEVPEDLQREDAVIHFARQEPLRVDFSDQRIHVTLRLAELDAGGQRSWRQLVVRASYQPLEGGRFPRIERDGYIQLTGARLRLRDQIALRGIFSKMFPRHPALGGLSEQWQGEPLLDGIENSQFVARDGWIGLAWSSLSEAAEVPTRAEAKR